MQILLKIQATETSFTHVFVNKNVEIPPAFSQSSWLFFFCYIAEGLLYSFPFYVLLASITKIDELKKQSYSKGRLTRNTGESIVS